MNMSGGELSKELLTLARSMDKTTFIKALESEYGPKGHRAIPHTRGEINKGFTNRLVTLAYGGSYKNLKVLPNLKLQDALYRVIGRVDKTEEEEEEEEENPGYESDEVETFMFKTNNPRNRSVKKNTPERKEAGGGGFIFGPTSQLTPAERLALRLDFVSTGTPRVTLDKYFEIVAPQTSDKYAKMTKDQLINTVSQLHQVQTATDIKRIAETISGGDDIRPDIIDAINQKVLQSEKQLDTLKQTAKTAKERLDRLAQTSDLDESAKEQYRECVDKYASFTKSEKQRSQAGVLADAVRGASKSFLSDPKMKVAAGGIGALAVGAGIAKAFYNRSPASKVRGEEDEKITKWFNGLDEEKRSVYMNSFNNIKGETSDQINKSLENFIADNPAFIGDIKKQNPDTVPEDLSTLGSKIKLLKQFLPLFTWSKPTRDLYKAIKNRQEDWIIGDLIKYIICTGPETLVQLSLNNVESDRLDYMASYKQTDDEKSIFKAQNEMKSYLETAKKDTTPLPTKMYSLATRVHLSRTRFEKLVREEIPDADDQLVADYMKAYDRTKLNMMLLMAMTKWIRSAPVDVKKNFQKSKTGGEFCSDLNKLESLTNDKETIQWILAFPLAPESDGPLSIDMKNKLKEKEQFKDALQIIYESDAATKRDAFQMKTVLTK